MPVIVISSHWQHLKQVFGPRLSSLCSKGCGPGCCILAGLFRFQPPGTASQLRDTCDGNRELCLHLFASFWGALFLSCPSLGRASQVLIVQPPFPSLFLCTFFRLATCPLEHMSYVLLPNPQMESAHPRLLRLWSLGRLLSTAITSYISYSY